jgi:hypothetical protein
LVHQGSPFNRKSPPADEPFVSTVNSTAAGSFRDGRLQTRRIFLELSVLRASVSIACFRRPRRRESSIFYRTRKYQWAKTTARHAKNQGFQGWGLGREARCTRALPECRPAVKAKWVGSWVGGFEVWLANLSSRQVRPQGYPRWTAWSTLRRHRR